MAVRLVLTRRRETAPVDASRPIAERAPVRILPTIVVGAVGGLIVGLTSVGSGSLMIVALMLMYPGLTTSELVGTDLVQAIPLVAAAALGHLLFGSVALGLTLALLIGGIPGVWFGAHLSSRANPAIVRPALFAVLMLSAMKLLGASDELLMAGVVAGVVAVVTAVVVARRSPAVAAEESLLLEAVVAE
jgi:hypothetical protein